MTGASAGAGRGALGTALGELLQPNRILRSLGAGRAGVVAGVGLSILGMAAAALGYLTPVEGALLQEAIDVAVILNALRALRIESRNFRSSESSAIVEPDQDTR